MFGLSPYLLGGAAIAALLAFGGGYIKGDADAANRYQVKIDRLQIDAADKAQKIRNAWAKQTNSAIASLEKKNEKSSVVFRTIHDTVDKIVERTIYRDGVCLDADGIVLVNAALGGVAAARPDSRQPDDGVSSALSPQ